MNKKLLEKLLEYIDLKFKELDARDSSDGGLMEGIHVNKLKKEMLEMIQSKQK